ncbi:T9SS C-terminal target domain-containing protein [Pontibacter oryzae]|uniref:T9SS C-terminal target domain-containing protein n=2 Tax=Pontibacter oryzae TaxID=2304593 RepID=A0A399SES0_9BACT|nr:T9SS C-terminal target domain-containing protein [Pontibacter oryzae]
MGLQHNQYGQNFDGMPATGAGVWASGAYYFPGWAVYRTKPTDALTANPGTANTGGLYSYGAINSTDRALGSLSSSTAGEFAYTLLLQNNTGSTIKSVELNYMGEQWRISNSTAGQHVISFWYAITSSKDTFVPSPNSDKGWTEVPELKFYGPKFHQSGGALNGNAADNRRMLEHILSVDIPAGHYLMLRWKDADEVEADHGLAIDDVSVKWNIEAVAAPTPLPVELVSFKARNSDDAVELQWVTASEDKNSHFEIERSSDGRNFNGIGSVQGQGSTQWQTKYTFTDTNPQPGTSFYRLKQVDDDEKYTYSSIVSVSRALNHVIKVYPTITSDEINVSANLPFSNALIVDMRGRHVMQFAISGQALPGVFDVRSLPSGMYVLQLLDLNGKRHAYRFEKL